MERWLYSQGQLELQSEERPYLKENKEVVRAASRILELHTIPRKAKGEPGQQLRDERKHAQSFLQDFLGSPYLIECVLSKARKTDTRKRAPKCRRS